ncbi:response regulator, partial [Kitasatospora sp. NPDC048296]|uniref:response regulator n=1 Tax=Kitasatospora sp. NPDC048296 TaxID=3364048 RepID=UPI00371A71DB
MVALRVLVVEDGDDLRFAAAAAAALRRDGFVVDEATDLSVAAEALRGVRCDCVVLDRLLPAGDAVGFVERLRRRGDAVPVLVLLVLDGIADRVEGSDAGGDGYLVKPFAAPWRTVRASGVGPPTRGGSGPAALRFWRPAGWREGQRAPRVRTTATGRIRKPLSTNVPAAWCRRSAEWSGRSWSTAASAVRPRWADRESVVFVVDELS